MARKCVQFDKTAQGTLLITLLPEGRQELKELIEDRGDKYIDSDECFHELIEHELGNGWDEIRPEEVGALTSGLLLTDDYQRDDNGTLTSCGRIYWDSAYQMQSAAEELWKTGKVEFVGQE